VGIFMGGDLNIPSEELLISYHTDINYKPSNLEQYLNQVEAARNVFQVDIAKSCHHGSSDFSLSFLSALNPIATVISSGDDEPYFHPRSDVLGSIGRYSRGIRPLIFSTELARSAEEIITHPNYLRLEFQKIITELVNITGNTPEEQAKKAALLKKHAELAAKINRSIAVYGAINLRTDGYKVVMAQKIERPSSNSNKWDIYRLEPEGTGPLTYKSRYE
ncbi:MAG: hypothetical protein MUF15_19925, partial [Acidobacteria bacterium]|nr:hypothetical protein [Acidobacteriota bacterium]